MQRFMTETEYRRKYGKPIDGRYPAGVLVDPPGRGERLTDTLPASTGGVLADMLAELDQARAAQFRAEDEAARLQTMCNRRGQEINTAVAELADMTDDRDRLILELELARDGYTGSRQPVSAARA